MASDFSGQAGGDVVAFGRAIRLREIARVGFHRVMSQTIPERKSASSPASAATANCGKNMTTP